MDIQVLYEDPDLLIIDKPPGITVNRAVTVHGETIQDWAEAHVTGKPMVGSAASEFENRAGIVHRIDRETSGALVIAKNTETFTKMQQLFKERRVRKTYLALVHGDMEPAEGEINAPVGRLPWNRERFGIVPEGRAAITAYLVIRKISFLGEPASLVEVYPKTGRTHQIRVHFKYAGHPLIGDFAYAGRKTSRRDRTRAPRVMLHAWKLSFVHPVSGLVVEVTAPIPDDMMTIIGEPV